MVWWTRSVFVNGARLSSPVRGISMFAWMIAPRESSRSETLHEVPSNWSSDIHRQYDGRSDCTRNRVMGFWLCRLAVTDTRGLMMGEDDTGPVSILSRPACW